MNCIDAIEGNVKKIISRLHDESVEQRLEDTEFIRCVKVILEATDVFLAENPEISDAPELLQDILLAHARKRWVEGVMALPAEVSDPEAKTTPPGDSEYLSFYFDNIYKSGNFPL